MSVESKPAGVTITTFGCKVNTYDTGLLQNRMKAAGFRVGEPTERIGPHVHVLNTCAVTAEATKEAIRAIRKIKAKNPFATVVVTGCAAQVDTDHFRKLPGADLVIANSHKGHLEEILDRYYRGDLTERVFHSNIFKKEDLETGGGIEDTHTRSFLKIQDGCNSFCTFCVIPFARGKSRSIPVVDLVRRVRELVGAGVSEVVLTGVHIGDYEDISSGKPRSLADLVEALLTQTSVNRIRLSSLEPIEITDHLFSLFSDERLCAHFHMSIQAANTEVLASMRRKYTAREVETALNRIATLRMRPFVGMDVIAGFPSETQDQFDDGYRRLANLPWTKLHVFPYSNRPGTKASRLQDDVGDRERSLRAMRLRELSLGRVNGQAQEQLGTIKQVLVLRRPSQGAMGLSRDFWPVDWDHSRQHWDLETAHAEIPIRIEGLRIGGSGSATLIGFPL